VRQRGGKRVTAFTVEGDFDPTTLASNSFIREWPPHSGRLASFAEVDRAAWFTLAEARDKINDGQRPLLDSLAELVAPPG
jgi:predicted NUDIX family NTP pyrophosphohydrolase